MTPPSLSQLCREVALLLAHTPEPVREARHLVRAALDLDETEFWIRSTDPVDAREVRQVQRWARKRASGVPLAHLRGYQPFLDLVFKVNAHVLIPRPESELLVEEARRLAPSGGRTLDIGTGSGALAISLAYLRPDLQVHASDCSTAALRTARGNAHFNSVPGITFHQADLLPRKPLRYDLILSNPPYIPSADIPFLEAEVRHDPLLALDGGPDGLAIYRRLALEIPPRLNTGGILLLELGMGQEQSVPGLFSPADWSPPELIPDLAGIPRVLCLHRT